MPKGNLGQAFIFYAIALALAVSVSVFAQPMGEGALALTMFTPAVAVLAMMVVTVPPGARKAFAKDLGIVWPGRRGMGLALGAPALIFAASFIVLIALGATAMKSDLSGSIPRIIVSSAIGFVITLFLAFSEEIGWRGYMLPRLLPSGAVRAMLIVGFLHGVWHLPLILLTDLYHPDGNRFLVVPLFLVTLTLAGVFYGYLRVWSGSIWPVALAHAAVNMFWSLTVNLSQTKSAVVEEYIGGESGLMMIAGLLLLDLFLLRRVRQMRLA